MWDLPRPGLEPVSPALAGGFPTTAPPGKPRVVVFICISLAPGEMMHLFLCPLFIDDVHFILCELLANPLPVFLFAAFSNALNPGLKLLASREDLYLLLPVAWGHSYLKGTFKNC